MITTQDVKEDTMEGKCVAGPVLTRAQAKKSCCSVRGHGRILKELWTKEVNIPEVKTSYEYITELREHLEDSMKLAQEELQKSQKRYKKYCDRKAKPRCLDVEEQVLILLLTDSNKLLKQLRGPYTIESRVGANDYRIKMGSKTKTYPVNMLKKYFARDPIVMWYIQVTRMMLP